MESTAEAMASGAQKVAYDFVIMKMRANGANLEQARTDAIQALRMLGNADPVGLVDSAVQTMQREAAKRTILERGVTAQRKAVEGDLREGPWYVGPQDGDRNWPGLRQRLEASSMAEAVPTIDEASTRVVAQFAQPNVPGLRKRGLVLGYVQSGKTANYTAVMAKAADAGYRTFIVLAGVHNNLRRQTQVRIDRDLDTRTWHRLTTADGDFGNLPAGGAVLSGGLLSIAVVKKNASRLRRLRDWLREIDPEIRRNSPILILDDEADQATPNSLAAQEKKSVINQLVRDLWAEVRNGTYVGYTATPFANIFMNPDDEEELFPADFIVDLPQSPEYFGAERIFGRTALDNADEPDDGLDMVRLVEESEAEILKPPTQKNDRLLHDPALPQSLEDAVRWFLIATAIRRTRFQNSHSSMLVHTSAYVDPHFAMQGRLEAFAEELRSEIEDGRWEGFENAFRREVDRVSEVSSHPSPTWADVEAHLGEVANDLRVVVDNGYSDDRLNYNRLGPDGEPVSEVVIAVGGGTLSRGLTLEGLCVSYFVRTSNTYDTLLQMGRWFGFRPGYEDLPRIWMPLDLQEDFRFLALVEEELRRDMRRLERLNVTPEQFGLRVRAHPGRLSITARNKMVHAEKVRLSYAGQRHQTTVLHEVDTSALTHNLEVTRSLVRAAMNTGEAGKAEASHTQFFNVPGPSIRDFISDFKFHPDQPGLRADHIVGWLRASVPNVPWNVVVMGRSPSSTAGASSEPTLGEVDLGLPYMVPRINRSPLHTPDSGVANIKALLSQSDWVVDFIDRDRYGKMTGPEFRAAREAAIKRINRDESWADEQHLSNGLLIIYAVSPASAPMRSTQQKSRRAMKADETIIGLGFIFPEGDHGDLSFEGDYYTVKPDWTVHYDDPEDLESLTEDSEPSRDELDTIDTQDPA